MAQPKKIFLDARELAHPLPLEHAIHALRELKEDNYFYMIHRKNPIPLIDLATEQGFHVFSKEDKDHIWHILISKNSDIDLGAFCDV